MSVNFSRCPPGTSCLTVQASPTGLGTLTVRTGSASGPVVGTCATLCTYGLAAGTTAVVTGSGVGGAVTGPWTGCGSVASGACTVTVSGDTRVSTRWQYPLTLTKASPYVALHVYGPSGFLATCAAAQTSCQFLLDPGARVRLQRTVSYPSNNANYRATLGWQGCIADTGNADACTPQVDGPTSATALYADEIRLQVSSAASGRVTSSPAGIDCGSGSPGICAAWFPFGTDVTLTATADAGLDRRRLERPRVHEPDGELRGRPRPPAAGRRPEPVPAAARRRRRRGRGQHRRGRHSCAADRALAVHRRAARAGRHHHEEPAPELGLLRLERAAAAAARATATSP